LTFAQAAVAPVRTDIAVRLSAASAGTGVARTPVAGAAVRSFIARCAVVGLIAMLIVRGQATAIALAAGATEPIRTGLIC